MMNFLSRDATIAKPGFNRWLVPPAAIAVHMCIGEVYGFSVFNVPLTQAGEGWTIPQVGWIYSIALFMLGISAAVFGKWVERSGPRKTMVASCICFCGGLLISAVGVKLKILWLLYIGYGFIGGIGLGLGYISPVSTLIKWFPDRPGMATGMAIMGFGASPFGDSVESTVRAFHQLTDRVGKRVRAEQVQKLKVGSGAGNPVDGSFVIALRPGAVLQLAIELPVRPFDDTASGRLGIGGCGAEADHGLKLVPLLIQLEQTPAVVGPAVDAGAIQQSVAALEKWSPRPGKIRIRAG